MTLNLALYLAPKGYGDYNIACPVCGDEAIHLEEVTRELEGHYANVSVVFQCECERHRFAVEFSAGKGQCWFQARELPKE